MFPVRRDCFSFLLEKWTDATKIMGYRVRDRRYGMQGKVNGVAFYAKDFSNVVDVSRIEARTNFDHLRTYTFGDIKSGLLVPINDWYCLKQHEDRVRISRETRLVHGERDVRYLDRVLSGAVRGDWIPELTRKLLLQGKLAKSELGHQAWRIRNWLDARKS